MAETESPFSVLVRLQMALDVLPDFFVKLLSESDWSLIIKLHALVEAALAHVIVHRLGDEEFDLADCEWEEWRERAIALLRAPTFTNRYPYQLLSWQACEGRTGNAAT